MFGKLKGLAKNTVDKAVHTVETKTGADLNGDGLVGKQTATTAPQTAQVAKPATQYAVNAPPLRTGGGETFVDRTVAALRRDRDAKEWEGISWALSEGNKVTPLQTPSLWGHTSAAAPTAPLPAASQAFCDAITSVIAGARILVDLSTLWWIGPVGMPDGAFEAAIAKGLAQCQAKMVRFIVGVPSGTNAKEEIIEQWLKRVTPGNAPFSIHVGRTHHPNPLVASWTHAKIIAADGNRCIVGGHNMWDSDYHKTYPVHDLSALVEGPATRNAHAFCSEMWARSVTSPTVSMWQGQLGRTVPSPQPVPGDMTALGSNRLLALGRMGSMVPKPNFPAISEFNHGTDASVSVRVLALCSAKSKIRISQQALGFLPAINGGFDFPTTLAICAAVKDGVQVEIVVSSDTEMVGYNGHLEEMLPHFGRIFALCFDNPGLPPRSDLDKWLQLKDETARDVVSTLGNKAASSHKPTEAMVQLFNQKISIAPLHYAPSTNHWIQPDGSKKLAANHAKVYVIDDSHYYFGSDNFYVSGTANGLEEYGFLVEGEAVGSFLESYWNPMWRMSSPFAKRLETRMY